MSLGCRRRECRRRLRRTAIAPGRREGRTARAPSTHRASRARDWRDCRSAWRRETCDVNSRRETQQGGAYRRADRQRQVGAGARACAQATGGVVINADSMQVYRDLRVLTARPTPEEEARVPHRLYGHVDAAVNFSAGAWVADAASVLAEARAQSRLPIFVGGSGLYFKALTRGLSAVPPIPAGDARRRARAAGARRRRGAACRAGAARSGFRRTAEAARPHPHRARARSGRGDRAFADRLASRGLPPLLPPGTFRAVFLAPERDAALCADRRAFRRDADGRRAGRGRGAGGARSSIRCCRR